MDAAEWERFGAFLADNGQVEVRPAPSETLTNDLLPGKLGG